MDTFSSQLTRPGSYAADLILSGVRRTTARRDGPRKKEVVIASSVEEFIRGPEGLDLGDEPFPKVVNTISEILDGGYLNPETGELRPYMEAFLEWGIGAGKDYTASVYLLCKAARVLQAMIAGTFWYAHGLARNSRIELAHFAPDEGTATDVLHAELVSKAGEAPWFRKFAEVDDKMRTRIRFKRSNRPGDYWPLEIVPRGCSQTKRLGRNLYAATIDEANFWSNTEGVTGDDVQNLYHSISRRLRSRFGDSGQLLMITSSNYDGDLSSRKEKEAVDPSRRIFYSKAASWEIKPPERYNARGETFTYEERDARGEVVRLWPGIPIDLKGEFDGDPQLALRDYAGVRYGDVQAFDPDAQWLFKEPPPPLGRGPIPGWRQPFIRPYELDEDYKPIPGVDYFIHFDLATSGDPRADGLGVGMAHAEFLPDNELFPTPSFEGEPYHNAVVVVDFGVRIMPKDVGGERSIEATRQFVYDLIDAGFNINCVSYDGYQSTDSRQILAQRGITSRLLSMDKSIGPYQTQKRLLHAGRVIYGPSVWVEEYAWLKMKSRGGGQKVDHVPGKSKDAADAVAGAVHSCWQHIVRVLAGEDPEEQDDQRVARRKRQRALEEEARQKRHDQRIAEREGRSKRSG